VAGDNGPEFNIEVATRMLRHLFAPWVLDLGLSVESVATSPPPHAATDWQPGVVMRMPFSKRLCRQGRIVSGQAIMALADTSMALGAASNGFPPITTLDQTTHFLKAVAGSDVLADARVVRLGRTMSFGRVSLLSANDSKPVKMVSSAFAML
jgi:acyl-coenzyme A thioesterase PaaI-like protein